MSHCQGTKHTDNQKREVRFQRKRAKESKRDRQRDRETETETETETQTETQTPRERETGRQRERDAHTCTDTHACARDKAIEVKYKACHTCPSSAATEEVDVAFFAWEQLELALEGELGDCHHAIEQLPCEALRVSAAPGRANDGHTTHDFV